MSRSKLEHSADTHYEPRAPTRSSLTQEFPRGLSNNYPSWAAQSWVTSRCNERPARPEMRQQPVLRGRRSSLARGTAYHLRSALFRAPGSRPSPARTSEGWPNRMAWTCASLTSFTAACSPKHHLQCKRRWIILSFHLLVPACAVGDASVQTPTIRCVDLRRPVETDTKPPLPLDAQIFLETARGLLGNDVPVAAKEAAAAEPEFQ